MVNIQLVLMIMEEKKSVNVDVKSLFLAGYTGRDQDTVKKHIEELRKIGIPAPEKVPVIYKVSPELLTNKDEIAVKSETTSGEIEHVILLTGEGVYITVGSDHTDREIEKTDIQKAKEACPKVIAKEAWLYDEIRDHWDNIIMRSTVLKDGVRTVYQEGSLRALLSAEDLLDTFDVKGEGIVLFSGTIPLRRELIYADEFEMEIYDPKMNRRISHKYKVKRVF